MHASDWLPTLAAAAGVPLASSLPLDGVSQWEALSAKAVATSARAGAAGSAAAAAAETWPPAARTFAVLGNATDMCEPRLSDAEGGEEEERPGEANGQEEEKRGRAAKAGCGFAIRLDDTVTGARWKLIRGYGGGPDTWCNASAGHHASCDNAELPPPGANATASTCRQRSPAGDSSAAEGSSHCLYELASDPHERSELTGVPAAYDRIVATLRAKMNGALRSYTQASDDPACGPAVFAHDARVGKVWQPWCDSREVGAEGSAETMEGAAADGESRSKSHSKAADFKSRSKREERRYDAFHPGKLWRDTSGRLIRAHSAGLLTDTDGITYWYGADGEEDGDESGEEEGERDSERRSGDGGDGRGGSGTGSGGSAAQPLVNRVIRVYSSSGDLYNWESRGVAFRCGPKASLRFYVDRPKVLRRASDVSDAAVEPAPSGLARSRGGKQPEAASLNPVLRMHHLSLVVGRACTSCG